MNTYHCLFVLGGEAVAAKIQTDRPLPLDIVRFASVILVDPSPEQFMKDRCDLAGKHMRCATKDEVRKLIESIRSRAACL